jgi:hypothetical protein
MGRPPLCFGECEGDWAETILELNSERRMSGYALLTFHFLRFTFHDPTALSVGATKA